MSTGVPGLSRQLSLRLSQVAAGSWAWAHLEAGATWPTLSLRGPSRVVPEGSQTPKCFTCLTHWSTV